MSTLISLLGSVSSTSLPVIHSSLSIPTNLHVLHRYYSNHFSYKYKEEYEFQDKILIFDQKQDSYGESVNSQLFSDLRFSRRQLVSNKPYSPDHHIKDFIDWSKNSLGDSLKDILKVSLDEREKLFTPIDKKIRLDYSHKHDGVIPLYSIYSKGKSSANKYSEITFGKHKSSHRELRSILNSPSGDSQRCVDVWKDKKLSYASYDNEEGYEGKCDQITIKGHDLNFPVKGEEKTLWTTPYAGYKFAIYPYWDEQYYYYSLGDLVAERGLSDNLISSRSPAKSWIVDYDDVFTVSLDGNKLMVYLNEDSLQLKNINFSFASSDNRALMNFLEVSSYFNFELSFKHLGHKFQKTFTLRDVLDEKAYVSLPTSKHIFSNFSLVLKPKNPNLVALANAKNNGYSYRINVDSLVEEDTLFEKIVFKAEESELYPSELLDKKKLANCFFLSSESEEVLTGIDPDLLRHLNVSAELDDERGTARLTYTFNGKTHRVNLDNMKSIPDFSGVNIIANSKAEAVQRLKELYPDATSYFWNRLIFQERPDSSRTFDSTLHISHRPFTTMKRLRLKKKWNFENYKIEITAPKDLSLIARKPSSSHYSNVSDLFDLSDYAKSLNLSKERDYEYITSENGSHLEVVAFPKQSVAKGRASTPTNGTKYIFHNLKKTSATNNVEPEEWWKKPFGSGNVVFTAASTALVSTGLVAVAKKLKLFKSKGS